MAGVRVPITPAVLGWAIEESGFSIDELAESIDESASTVRAWVEGRHQPILTQFRKVALELRRPLAAFLLPAPPREDRPEIQFRSPPNAARTALSPVEIRHVRDVARLQGTLSWTLREVGAAEPLPQKIRIGSPVERVAKQTRESLGMEVSEHMRWKTPSRAQNAWRSALENAGILVFFLPLGESSCRGFSLWDDHAPAITINTWWKPEARIFSMMHEYAHLLSRSNSACLERAGRRLAKNTDPAERWSERVAAATVLPWPPIAAFLRRQFGWREGTLIRDLGVAGSIARRFKVSLTASVLRLIQQDCADWELFHSIPRRSDDKGGGGGGSGRDRLQKRKDEYGHRVTSLFVEAMDQDLVSRSDVLNFLRVSDNDLDTLRRGYSHT